MGIPSSNFTAAQLASAGVVTPSKPVRAARGKGDPSRRKAEARCAFIAAVSRPPEFVSLLFAARLVNETNARENHFRRSERAKAQRQSVCHAAMAVMRTIGWPAPWKVTMTRIAPGQLDDDNLAASCKHVRDGCADAGAVDDGDKRWQWIPQQRIGKEHQVEIRIEPIPEMAKGTA